MEQPTSILDHSAQNMEKIKGELFNNVIFKKISAFNHLVDILS